MRRGLCLIPLVALLAACGGSGQNGPAKNSIAAARATSEAVTQPMTAPTAPPMAMSAADAPPVAPMTQTFNQVAPGLDLILVTLAVVFGIPAFWMVSLGTIRRNKKRTA